MKRQECANELAARMQRVRRRIDAAEYDSATHECRKALEFIVRYVYSEVLHECYRPKEGLDGAIKAGCFRDLWPPLLRGKIALVKELGDQGSHVNVQPTEREAIEAFNALCDVAGYLQERFLGRELAALVERSPLTIEVATDLSEIVFDGPGGRLSIDSPLLLLESLAGRNEAFRFADRADETPNRFAEHELGKQVLKLMGDANLIRFGETEVLWDEGHSEWPPSIDSLFTASLFLGNARLRGVFDDCARFAEVGCGTGFISSVVCRTFDVEDLWLSDIHDRVLDLAEFNVRRNVPEQAITRKRGPGLRAFGLERDAFDVIFANPPYIRVRPDEVEVAHSTRSTGLLDEVLLDFWKYARCLVLNYSSCCSDAVSKLVERVNADGVHLSESVVARRPVPFRVLGMSKEDLGILTQDGRLIDLDIADERRKWPELMADNRGFRFWHEVIVSFFAVSGEY